MLGRWLSWRRRAPRVRLRRVAETRSRPVRRRGVEDRPYRRAPGAHGALLQARTRARAERNRRGCAARRRAANQSAASPADPRMRSREVSPQRSWGKGADQAVRPTKIANAMRRAAVSTGSVGRGDWPPAGTAARAERGQQEHEANRAAAAARTSRETRRRREARRRCRAAQRWVVREREANDFACLESVVRAIYIVDARGASPAPSGRQPHPHRTASAAPGRISAGALARLTPLSSPGDRGAAALRHPRGPRSP